jgi:hypothetical protein
MRNILAFALFLLVGPVVHAQNIASTEAHKLQDTPECREGLFRVNSPFLVTPRPSPPPSDEPNSVATQGMLGTPCCAKDE